MKNYFNTLSINQKMDQLSKCRFMNSNEFDGGVSVLLNKKIVIIGCGAQGLNQGLNMRDSGLDISYSLSCLLYTSPSPRDGLLSRMPSSA